MKIKKRGSRQRLPYIQNAELTVDMMKQEAAISDKITEKIDGAMAIIMALDRAI